MEGGGWAFSDRPALQLVPANPSPLRWRQRGCVSIPPLTLFLPMNRVAQPSRLRVRAASRRSEEHGAGRPVNSQARTPALQAQSRFRGSRREQFRGNLSPLRGEGESFVTRFRSFGCGVSRVGTSAGEFSSAECF